jgi:hypothetical protein
MLPRKLIGLLIVVISIEFFVDAVSLIEIEKPKDLKKTIATKTNLLVLYAANPKSSDVVAVKNLLKSVDGSFAVVDCSDKTLKKQLCKKALPDDKSFVLKHYKDGTFNKDYDRQLTKNSMQYFLKDPTGDIPYEEDQTSNDVIHISDMQVRYFDFQFINPRIIFDFLSSTSISHTFLTAIRQAVETRKTFYYDVLHKLVRLLSSTQANLQSSSDRDEGQTCYSRNGHGKARK